MDVYIWESAVGGNPPPGPDPGNVLCMIPGVSPGPVAFWPSISQHNIQICCETNGEHFAGFWGDFQVGACGWFIASDEDGPALGNPRTKIAPGIGYPTGWQHPNVVPTFAGCKALGIRVFRGPGECELTSGTPDPDAPVARKTTWGTIKALY
jgi:hypothetical protein